MMTIADKDMVKGNIYSLLGRTKTGRASKEIRTGLLINLKIDL